MKKRNDFNLYFNPSFHFSTKWGHLKRGSLDSTNFVLIGNCTIGKWYKAGINTKRIKLIFKTTVFINKRAKNLTIPRILYYRVQF